MLTQSEDKEDNASVVQLDPGGKVSDMLEVEKMHEKSASESNELVTILFSQL